MTGAEIVLDGEEAHHALHVVRLRAGDRVAIFDGCGGEVVGIASEIRRHEVSVTIEERREHPRPRTRVVLIQAYLNREKNIETLVRRGTELGVAGFRFFPGAHSERTVRMAGKWRRAAIETCKQCGRFWLPDFETPESLDAALEGPLDVLLLADKETGAVPLRQALAVGPASCGIVLGPEGGLTSEEAAAVRARGALSISLGDATYRSEEAAALAAALVLYELGQLGPR